MKKSWWVKFVLCLILVIGSGLLLVPTMFFKDSKHSFPIKSKITLGLDLQGGLYMVLGVNLPKALEDEVKTLLVKLQYQLQDQGHEVELGEINRTDIKDPQQAMLVSDSSTLPVVEETLKKYFSYGLREVGREPGKIYFGLTNQLRQQIESSSIEKSTEVIRNRIDQFGVAEPDISTMGVDKVVVQLPGVKDVEKAKELIGRTAKLEFKFVHDSFSQAQLDQFIEKAKKANITYEKGANFKEYHRKLNEYLRADLPAAHEIYFEKAVNPITLQIDKLTPYLLESNAALSGEDLQDASVQIDPQEQKPFIGISFKPTSAKRFADITEKNVGRFMAIVLDDNIYSAPRINGKIAGGEASITLGALQYDKALQEARDLALVLRAGALPVELEFQEQRIVGPSLGADSIAKASKAAVIACSLVFIFMMYYYRFAGLIASITLVMNVLLTLACLALFEATLTLPGIAGIALTVGMAVDGNIIIYERIREELRKGIAAKAAVAMGFESAFWTILDANITTFVAGLALLNFGTGPIRGFALTLIVGVIVTVYTAYFANHLMFERWMKGNKSQQLSI